MHFQQISDVLGIDVKLVEELNPQYRRSIVNGNNRPSILRLPMNFVTQFIDMEDTIYTHRADELLTKRTEVEVSEVKPTYTPQRKTYTRKKGKASVRKGARRGKSTARKSSRGSKGKKAAVKSKGKKSTAKKGKKRR